METENNNLPEIENQKKQFGNGIKFIRTLIVSNWGSLLLLFLGVYIPLQIFEIMSVKLRQNAAGFPWDIPILRAIHQTKQPGLDTLALTLTNIGSPKSLLLVLLTIALVLILQKRWRMCTFLLTTGLGSYIINRLAKEFMHRARPNLWESTYHLVDFSFPSGHAMGSMTFASILIVLTWKTPWRLPALIFGSIFLPTIAWTRLYLAVHFPSDILAGWLVSLAWTIGVYIIIRPHWTVPNISEN
jgi:undecaprenyl-diphosphatase